MKKLIFVLALLAVVSVSEAQVYDGITQPTKFRFWTPVVNTGNVINALPFAGYKEVANENISYTFIGQYNIQSNNLTPQVWVNFNYEKEFWTLFRFGTDINTWNEFVTWSGTWKITDRWMADFTWYNIYNKGFFARDKLQVLAGYKLPGKFVINGGVRFLGDNPGVVTNLRLMIDEFNWLQFGYDIPNNKVIFSTVIQFD